MSNRYQLAKEYLQASFQVKGFEPHFFISKGSLLKILDAMSGQTFDRDLAMELFEQCEIDFKGFLKIDNFIDVVIRADSALNEKINNANIFIQQLFNEKNRMPNQNRKMIFSVRILGGRNIYSQQLDATHKPYIIINYDQEKRTTKLAHNDQMNPKWDETFIFPVKSGMENTFIQVLDMNPTTKQSFLLGEVHFGLRELQDQLKHNQWFNLYDKYGQQISGSIQLELQLLMDENQYHSEAQQLMQKQLENTQQEKLQFESDLKNLYAPFKQTALLQQKKLIIPDAPQLMFVNELSKPVVYQGEQKIDLTIYKTPILTDSRVLKILNQLPDSFTTVHPENDYPAQQDLEQKGNFGFDHLTKDIKILAFFIIIYLLISIFLCWIKTDFVNITIAITLSFVIRFNYFEGNHTNIFAVFLMLTLLYDVSWLAAYSDIWWVQSEKENPQEHPQLITIQRFTIISTYVVIIIKIILSCQLWNLKIEKLNEHNQFGIGTHLYQYKNNNMESFPL